ncbi:hypothetical protein O3M35_010865 [Rhynocoris fuscipes]|uniref:Complement component 1 Q subcomponent-binding protein, mitochondrial n=1 Tax=Rhynocoris fuscipes TaxID=488301 RepID=A0AAW1D3P3_9HEMI
MSGLMKNILKPTYLRTASSFLTSKITKNVSSNQLNRSLWSVCSVNRRNVFPTNAGGCSCGCQTAFIHTKGEKELAEFLTEEIAAEKQLQERKLPNEVNGFKVEANGPEVILTKNMGHETIKIVLNVNHAVGEETDYDTSESAPTSRDDAKPIVNRPPFDVEIVKDGKILGFKCSMVVPPPKDAATGDDGYNDLFTIDEVVMSNGSWKETDYHVPGEIMDGTLYDLLMNLLEDKGVHNEFVEKLTSFSTDYEHSLYIKLLEDMQRFVSSSK